MWGRCANHPGLSSNVGAQTNARKWAFATGGAIYSSPAIGADGTVYVGSYDRDLYAIGP
jgi:outer membrane protein assembly factor BamB